MINLISQRQRGESNKAIGDLIYSIYLLYTLVCGLLSYRCTHHSISCF
jgi:hypothetical protein